MLPISKPDIRLEDIEAVTKVLLSGNLVQGQQVEELESAFSRLHNVPFAVAVSNGTAALHLSLLALGVAEGDEVIVTAYSFIASANAIVLSGAKPVFCDVAPDSYNMDAGLLKTLISPRTKAIIVVHEFGIPAEMQDIMSISEMFGIPIIEDAACALGSSYGGRLLGSFGNLSCFSFHPRKLITSGEGGLILVSNEEQRNFLQSMRNHGLDLESQNRKYIHAGFNYRMSDISASLLLNQLSRLDSILIGRQRIAERYFAEIVNPGIKLPTVKSESVCNWQTFPVRFENKLKRDKFVSHANSLGISAILPAQNIPSEPFYSLSSNEEVACVNAEKLWEEAVALPMFELMTDYDVRQVIEACNDF